MPSPDPSGKLWLVGTPIGNLGDITLRALDTLRAADAIACEDTRHTLGLLNYYQIKKPLLSCHEHNERESAAKIAAYLRAGKNVALVSDAGMPAVSDPGAAAVDYLRGEGFTVEVVPGATAAASAVALCGMPVQPWTFLGFLPAKKRDAERLLTAFREVPSALVLYVSPHDIAACLRMLYACLGERRAHIVKELTKIHESHVCGPLSELRVEDPRGEYVIVAEKPELNPLKPTADEAELCARVRVLIADGEDRQTAIKKIAREAGVEKNVVYQAMLREKES